jgi:Flp pilus assembly protein CpaB
VVTAVAAVVLAVTAGVLVWKYTDDAEDDAKKPFQFVSALVANERVPLGTSFTAALDGKLIVRKQIVRDSLPPSYIPGEPNDARLRADFGKLVASHDIAEGVALVKSDFVGQGTAQSGVAGVLENDEKNERRHLEAVTISLDDPKAVAGYLQPGDKVNVWWTGDVRDLSGRVTAKLTGYLLSGVKVLGVGDRTAGPQATASSPDGSNASAATPRPRSLVTLEVTPQQAAQVIHAQATGAVYLSLNPPSFEPGDFADPGELVEIVNLFRNPDTGPRPLPVLEEYLRNALAARPQ